MFRLVALSVLIPLLVAGCAPGHLRRPSPPQTREATSNPSRISATALAQLGKTIDEAVEADMQTEHVPGVSVIVVDAGQTVFKRGYGVADVATGQRVDPDTTLFRIGSVSKALTALALTRLVAEGRQDMDDDVSRHVTGIRNVGGFRQPVTVRNLLTHTGGFDQIGLDRQIRSWGLPLADRKAMRPSLKQFLEAGNLRRTTPPGLLFRYDTYGSTLAGLLLEEATGVSYPAAMRRELFSPLGMENSFVEADAAHFERLAKGYGYEDGAYVAQPYEVYVTTPASSVDATPADMGLLLEALTADGANAHGRLFDAATTRAVLAPQFRSNTACPGVTHGFFEGPTPSVAASDAPRTIGHGGNVLGFSALLTIVPASQLGIFVVANRDQEAGGGPVRLTERVTDLVVTALARKEAPFGGFALASKQGDYAGLVGRYYYGAFCHTCTTGERTRGGWAPGEPKVVTAFDRGVRVGKDAYLATTTAGVFVREDGSRHVCFSNGAPGGAPFFSFSSSPYTFERGG